MLVQAADNLEVIVNPPFPLMSTEALDAIYDLPFTRLPHPKYNKRGPIPAMK